MKIVTFGEIMGRLTPGLKRLRQALPGTLEVSFAGAEANVAASLSMLGKQTSFVTALPNNPLADACIASLANHRIGVDDIVRTDNGRLGLYFLETGANQRAGQVVYDRDGSSISLAEPNAYDWESIFNGAEWFHTTGITPAISSQAADSTLDAVRRAKQSGCTVSCDLNFRKKLWKWEQAKDASTLARETMTKILPFVDVVIANEEDCETVLGIHAADTDVASGKLSIDRYPDVAQQVLDLFPNVQRVAITLRESLSASHNNWGAMLHSRDAGPLFAPSHNNEYQPYAIKNIVDRVGAGDSFAAGLIFALSTEELATPETAIRFATAASCLAHSILGDFNYSTRSEIEALMGGAASGRVVR